MGEGIGSSEVLRTEAGGRTEKGMRMEEARGRTDRSKTGKVGSANPEEKEQRPNKGLASTWVLLPSASSSPRSLSAAVRLLLGFQAFSALFSFISSLINTVAMILRGSFRGPC